MKKVFTDISWVAHLWAHQQQEEARNSGNFYYYGRTIYSYGGHFPIAVILERDSNKVLINASGRRSVTTSKHQRVVSGAISHKDKIDVPYPTAEGYDHQHQNNIKYFISKVKEYLEKQVVAKKIDYVPTALHYVSEARKYLSWFPEFKYKKYFKKAELKFIDEEWVKSEGARVTKIDKEKARKAFEKRAAEIKRANEKAFAEWRNFERDDVHFHLFTNEGRVALRYNKENKCIETSKGIKLSLVDAKKVLNFILKYKNSGTSYKQGLVSPPFTVHGFTVNEITKDGGITVGCHKVCWSEIEMIVKRLNWKLKLAV